MAYQTKNTAVWIKELFSGAPWLYNQPGITYDDTDDIYYNSSGLVPAYSIQTKNTTLSTIEALTITGLLGPHTYTEEITLDTGWTAQTKN